MELIWSWIPVLGSLMFVDILWTSSIHEEQWLRPEDVELAELVKAITSQHVLFVYHQDPRFLRLRHPTWESVQVVLPGGKLVYPINQTAHECRTKSQGYLRRYYHLKPQSRASSSGRQTRSTSAMEEKMRQMQDFFGLRETGRLDPQTLAVMKEDRCGVPDVENFSLYPRKPKWKSNTITYKIVKYTPDMKRENVESSFHSALKIWSDAAPLKFIKVNHGKADIVLSFERKTHGDFFPFDGPKGVLAHAFEPGEGMGGDVHFDEDETWMMGQQKPGYNLFTVAAHELGHSLGLSHSKEPSAIMYPKYKYFNSAQYTLPKDDMLGIQTLYGKPTTKPQLQPIPQKCDPDFSVDAVAVIGEEIVFFKNRYMWMRTTWTSYWNRLSEGHSSTYLPSINSPVDAAYDIPAKGVAYVFTGLKYWVVEELKMKSSAGSIYEYGFSTAVKQVDAAVHIREYGKTFFFIENVYYRYDENRRRMDPGFPRPISMDWPIMKRVDAAFELQGTIYLFSGTKAYQYDLEQNQVLNTIPANAWLGC